MQTAAGVVSLHDVNVHAKKCLTGELVYNNDLIQTLLAYG